MNGLSADLRKYVTVASITIAVIASIVAAIIVQDKLSMVVSIFCGTGVAVGNFTIMALAGEKAIEMTADAARKKMTISYIIRYVIYLVALLLAIKIPFFNPIGMVIGFLTSILALYLTQVLDTPGNRDKIGKLLRRAK